jgi:hypothetical protein
MLRHPQQIWLKALKQLFGFLGSTALLIAVLLLAATLCTALYDKLVNADRQVLI